MAGGLFDFQNRVVSRAATIMEVRGVKVSVQNAIKKLGEVLRENVSDDVVSRIEQEAFSLEGIDTMNIKVLASAYRFMYDFSIGDELTQGEFKDVDLDPYIDDYLPENYSELIGESRKKARDMAKATLLRYVRRIIEYRATTNM